MIIYDKEEVRVNQERLVKELKSGAIFIYPTDTIYGIGCDARDGEAVRRIREIKKRMHRPFSVIAPSRKWIYDNCEVDERARKWIEDELPGPYTLIIKLKNKDAVSEEVVKGHDTLGVRIPDHWCSRAIRVAGVPVVTTSANVKGEDYMTSLEDLSPDIKAYMNFGVYEGELAGRPSQIVDLSKDDIQIRKR